MQVAFTPQRSILDRTFGSPLALPGALVLTALFALAATGFSQIPRGVFSLSGSGQPAGPLALANPNVIGIGVRYDWASLEPSEGNFDWSFLDSEIANVAAAGKQVLLRIGTQSGKPAWVTAAIQKAGGKFFSFDHLGVPTTIPVFWDPTFLAKKKAMIAALGAHFTNNPAIPIVAASFANATSEDWNVPHTDADVANWFAAGYTTAKMLDAGKQILDATMAAFPNQYVTLAIASNGHAGATGNLDPTGTYVAENAVATARASWPGRLIVQINSLAAINPVAPGPDGSPWNLIWKSQPDVAAQMLWFCSNDSTYRNNGGVPDDPAAVLTRCVDAAASYGLSYIEIYQSDVANLPAVITYAQKALGSPGLLNVSTRLKVGLADQAAISGFIVGGSGMKRVMLRAIGPSLKQAGITGTLPDPFLELHDATGAIIATNDNWETTQIGGVITEAQEAALRGTSIAPADPAEAAIIADLAPGAYTAVIHGAHNETGIGLAEMYDLAQAAPATVANLSTRGFAQTGADVLIGGFIVGGSDSSKIVVRALGPSLAQADVSNALADPTLDLRDANGALVASNDNWADTQEAAIQDSGLAPSNTHEAAIEQTLAPGSYTATVAGKNGSTGVGLVEVYRLP